MYEDCKNNEKSILLSSLLIFSGFFDQLVSYVFYCYNPTIFVKLEMNKETILFFTEGVFPMKYYFGMILLIPCIFYVLYHLNLDIEANKSKKTTGLIQFIQVSFILAIVVSSLSHILAGLRWYYHPPNSWILVMSLHFSSMCMLVFIAILLSIRKEKATKSIFLRGEN